MRTIDMHDYTPAARRVWFAFAIVGFAALVYATAMAALLPREVQSKALVVIAVAGLVGCFPVRIPGTRLAFAASEVFLFLGLLLFGPAVATIAAVLESTLASLRSTRRWTSRILTPALSAFGMLTCGIGFEKARAALGPEVSFAATLDLLFGVALAYYAMGTVLPRIVIALKERAPLEPLRWLRQYFWVGLAYLASASVAATLYASHLQFGLEAILIGTPLVAMFVAALHFYFQAKEADRRHVGELMQSEQRLQEALKAAEQASRAKTQFLAAASHDLRQPLHALSFLTAALDLRQLDDGSRAILGKMAGALDDLSREFDMLLDISKLDAGVVPVVPATFELAPFLERVCEPFRGVAHARGLAFRVEADADVFVHTDRGLLERIVRNLVDNAFKYTTRGAIRIACAARGERCEIAIADTGIGIPEAEREHVFEEFYQLGNPERDRRKGLGLGLSIVRRLARLLGAGLSMSSTVGAGTTFNLALERVPRPAAPPPRELETTPNLRERQVLLIDDEAAPREALRGYLEALGCKVSVAATSEEAAAIALFEEPDIVLADFRLRGGQTGLQAIQRLRQSHPGLPAIVVTGDTAPDRLAQLEGTGIDVLYKPVAPARLVEALTAALPAPHAEID